jgi:hypothetical protein
MHKSLWVLALCLLSGAAPSQSAAAGGEPFGGEAPAPPTARAAMPTAPAPRRAAPSLAENEARTRAVPQAAQNSARAAPEQTAGSANTPGYDRYAECVKLWDAGTHMSKRDWSRTCRRVANRLENLQVENTDADRTAPKTRRKGRSPNAG